MILESNRVSRLFSLLKSNNLGEDVKLADIAEEYRKKTGKRPVVLLDSSSSLPYIQSKRSLVLAGELKNFKQYCEEFLNRFHDLDIELYVIEDGLKPKFQVQKWRESTDAIVRKSDMAYSTRDLSFANDRGGFLYSIMYEVFAFSDKCKFLRAHYHATQYIAQYLKENGAFGVISNNSDVILMEGSHYFLSIADFNLSEMTTFNFNRNKLAEFLRIKAQLLPHVGTLCPNGVFNIVDLKKFFNRNCNTRTRDKGEKFRAVASFVRHNLSDFKPKDYSPTELRYCQSKLCLNEHQLENYMKRLKILNGEPDEESEIIEDKRWNDIVTRAKTLHREGRDRTCLLQLLLEKQFFCGIGSENVNTTTPGEQLQDLRRKIYGFLFFEYPGETSVTEHLYSFRNDRTQYCTCEVTFELRDHVGLLKLWSEEASEDIQKQKYEYFFGTINEKLNPDILLGEVQDEFVFPLLATFYLCYELGKFDNPTFINALLLHNILANKLSANEVAKLDCEPDFDVLNMCGWYLKVIQHLDLVNSVCGYPFDRSKTNIVNYFDGLVLQRTYRDLNTGKGVPEELLPTFKCLKKVLMKMKQCCGF